MLVKYLSHVGCNWAKLPAVPVAEMNYEFCIYPAQPLQGVRSLNNAEHSCSKIPENYMCLFNSTYPGQFNCAKIYLWYPHHQVRIVILRDYLVSHWEHIRPLPRQSTGNSPKQDTFRYQSWVRLFAFIEVNGTVLSLFLDTCFLKRTCFLPKIK